VDESKGIPAQQLPANGIRGVLRWALVIALIVGLSGSLFLCWRLQKQLDQVREEQELAKRELASVNRVEVVEQSGVFHMDMDRGKPVYFPQPYDAPPAITLEPFFRPFANPGGEGNEAKLKGFQQMQDNRTREAFKEAMKAFDLEAIYPDYFRWGTHVPPEGTFPRVEVKWTARGLIGSKRKIAK
jgi:hypothetical protein